MNADESAWWIRRTLEVDTRGSPAAALVVGIGRTVLEYLFPQFSISNTIDNPDGANKGNWEALKSGDAFRSVVWWEVLTGSMAEGLAVPHGQRGLIGGSDRDVMYLYGGVWGVRVDGNSPGSSQTPLMMSHTDDPPGYCRVRLVRIDVDDVRRMADTVVRGGSEHTREGIMLAVNLGALALVGPAAFMSYYMAACTLGILFPNAIGTKLISYRPYDMAMYYLGNLPPFNQLQIGTDGANMCIVDREGQHFLSSRVSQGLLRNTRYGENFQGPAQCVGLQDLVPALVCSGPFPCIQHFLSRQRCSQWPLRKDLDEIAILPGLLVPVGKKGSSNRDLLWRQSCSLQELCLCRSMPMWAKVAFRAAKHMLKYVKKQMVGDRPSDDGNADQDEGRSVVCSYHLKTTLLWLLEESTTWQLDCSFLMMIRLLVRLDYHLATGHMWNYFNTTCDLLDNVPAEERQLARNCIQTILSNPVKVMVDPYRDSRGQEAIWHGTELDRWLQAPNYLMGKQAAFEKALLAWKAQGPF